MNVALAISCTRCCTLGLECDWEGRVDNRRRLSDLDARTLKQTIRKLEEKAKGLEEILRKHGLNEELDAAKEVRADSEEDMVSSFGRLVVSLLEIFPRLCEHSCCSIQLENGAVQYYGKSSPFSHHPPPPSTEFDLPRNWYQPYQLKLKPEEDDHLPSNWNTILPANMHLVLSRHEHDRALLEFFLFFAGWQLRVIPHLFLRDMGIATSNPTGHLRTQHYSKMLHNAILSVAFAYSEDEGRCSRAFRDQFAKEAKSLLETECQHTSLATVMGLAVLSSYHSGFSEQSKWGLSLHTGHRLRTICCGRSRLHVFR